MRRTLLVLLTLGVLAVVPAGASAAKPDFHDHGTDTFTDPDFCGTGESVDVVESFNAIGYDSDTEFRLAISVRDAITYNGMTVYAQLAGRVHAVATEGVFGGAHTELVRESGLRSKLRIPGQGVLTSDHGLLVYELTFDETGEVVDVNVIKDAGGHPDFFDPVWCEAATSAFGIPFSPE
jgi:hypothetical protein